MSSVYIGRVYKSHTTKSIPEYINELRMEKAKDFLLSTEMSMEEIASKIGFNSKSYFYRVFKKLHGVTPNEYKQVHRSQ